VAYFIDYLGDEDGWGHTMQVHPDGRADYVSHSTRQLDHAIRWILRTDDQQAYGMIELATAEVEGYLAEKAKENLKVILSLGGWSTADPDRYPG